MKTKSDWADTLEVKRRPFYIAECYDCGGTLSVTTLRGARQHAIDNNHNVQAKRITVTEFNYGPEAPGAAATRAYLGAQERREQ